MKGHLDSVDINFVRAEAVTTMGWVVKLWYFSRERNNGNRQISRNVRAVDNSVAANSQILRDFLRLHFFIREGVDDKA